MLDDNDAILIPQKKATEKRGFKQKFREEIIYPLSKQHFLQQWQNAPMDLRFRLTNKCDENCIRCFECSGPNNPLNTVPIEDIAFYTNTPNNKFKQICMTGGEWSLIYNVHPHYLRKAFDKIDIDASDEYIVQTNARWINGKNREQILNDLRYIQNKLGDAGKIFKLDTSVDRYRSDYSINAVIDLIRTIAGDDTFKHTKIRILSCALDARMANERVLQPDFFKPYGIDLKFQGRSWFNPYFEVCYANNTRIVIHEESPTMSIGRAKQNNIGYKIYYPTLQCDGLQPEHSVMELTLREDGMIKWHNWYDWNIMTSYIDKNNKHKPIEQIRQELIQLAWKKYFRHNIKDIALKYTPIIGLVHQIYIHRQIKKSWRDNQKQFIHYATPIKEL